MPIYLSDSLKHSSDKAGLPPGSLVHVGKTPDQACRISVIKYDNENFEEYEIQSINEVFNNNEESKITWVNIEGLRVVDVIEAIGNSFDIHPLVLEDILNTHQRQKFEDYENFLFVVLKALIPSSEDFSVEHEQLSMIVMSNIILTFKEKQDDLFDPLRHRLSNSKGRIRCLGSDYLAYAICDAIVDQYILTIDSMVDTIESTEDELLADPTRDTLFSIQNLRRELIFIRKNVLPIREVISEIQRSESLLLNQSTQIYFRDVYDHSLRVIESLDSYRELLNGLLEIYLSSISNKMNETMKVLTVFASIFIPLTFIAGIYGMNFEYMPELKWKWAYPALWIVFVIIPFVLLIYFKKKKWL
jgi:magnesium transporter